MTDFIDVLEQDLVAAARRRRDARHAALALRLRGRFGSGRAVAFVAALVLAGSATAAATYAVVRSNVIAGPDAQAVPPDQLPAPGTSRVSELRAADPDAAAPPWTLRLSRSTTGQLCTTTGQLQQGQFGLVGLDGTFRTYEETAVDGCGAAPGEPGGATLAGARVFDADARADVRTVVAGVGGAQLQEAQLTAGGRAQTLELGPDGTFVTALAGYPEDHAVELVLRFDGGREERHPFGVEPGVVTDPLGGPAWRVEGFGNGEEALGCVMFSAARAGLTPPADADDPRACGTAANERPDGIFFAARAVVPADHGMADLPPRTVVWGAAGSAVERVEVVGPDGAAQPAEIQLGGEFLALHGPDVDPATLTVRVTHADGRVEEHRGDTNLIDTEGQGR